MFRFLIFLIISLSVSDLFGQEMQTRSLPAFHMLRVEGPVDVRLLKGSGHSVRIESRGFPSGKVEAQVIGSTLRISVEGYALQSSSKVDVWVTYKDLDRIIVSGAGNVFGAEILKTTSLDLEVSSAATIELEAEVEQLSIEATTAGQVIVVGKAAELDIESSTSAGVDTYRLIADEVRVAVKTAASCKVHVLKSIDAQVSTAGSLRYRGAPARSNLQSATGGSIRRAD